MITIVDYGSGNLRSVQKAFERLGATATITDDPNVVAAAERLVLPGVGAVGDAMRELDARGLVEPIQTHVRADRPFFGICMGLQLLFETGWEGGRHAGLGLLEGDVARFDIAPELKVPHMGWNTVSWRGATAARPPVADNGYFYFVHSYFPVPEDDSLVAATTRYGQDTFAAAIETSSLLACQFHPEKSQDAGLRLLRNFLKR